MPACSVALRALRFGLRTPDRAAVFPRRQVAKLTFSITVSVADATCFSTYHQDDQRNGRRNDPQRDLAHSGQPMLFLDLPIRASNFHNPPELERVTSGAVRPASPRLLRAPA